MQEPVDTFLLFITTPLFDIHPDFQTRLRDSFESNVTGHSEISGALMASVGTIIYDEVDESKREALGFAKTVVASAARDKGWVCEHLGIYVYESPSRNRILNSVIRFSKAHSGSGEVAYVEDIVRIIQQMPEYHSDEDAFQNQEVREHLETVKAYREQVRGAYRE